MNQILVTNYHNHKKILKIQFISSIIITVFLVIYNFSIIYNKNKKENLSKNLLNSFNISLLYSNNNNYITSKNSNVFSVIGVINIEKLKITYPIIDIINDDLLKISPCRFYGPDPNNPGNLCIAAHNYNDTRFFSKISTLKYGDIVNIVDLSGISVSYYVYKSYETDSNDTTCVSQDTNRTKRNNPHYLQ